MFRDATFFSLVARILATVHAHLDGEARQGQQEYHTKHGLERTNRDAWGDSGMLAIDFAKNHLAVMEMRFLSSKFTKQLSEVGKVTE
jgi:hypothetical protein